MEKRKSTPKKRTVLVNVDLHRRLAPFDDAYYRFYLQKQPQMNIRKPSEGFSPSEGYFCRLINDVGAARLIGICHKDVTRQIIPIGIH